MTKIQNQEQVVDAAARVFAAKGYDAARLEDIAAELGVLQGSLYYYIGSKAGLLRLVRVRRFREITDSVQRVADGPGTSHDKLRSAILTHLRYLERHLAESPNWFRHIGNPRRSAQEVKEDRALTSRYRGSWKSILQQGVEDGTIRADLDLGVTVLSMLGMFNWLSVWYEAGGERTIEDVAASQFELTWAGLAAPRRRRTSS